MGYTKHDMRVVEPHQFTSIKKKKKQPKRNRLTYVVPLLLLVFVMDGLHIYSQRKDAAPSETEVGSIGDVPALENEELRKSEMREFTGEEFKAFYLKMRYPNTRPLDHLPSITGYEIVDDRIRKI